MVDVPFIDADALARLLPMEAAIEALERAFGDAEPAEAPPRTHLAVEGGTLLLMPAAGELGGGVKLVTINPANPDRGLPLIQGLYVLFAPDTLAPAAIIDGTALTALRTGAVSALATRLLARPDARRLVLFGAGAQAAAHLDAMMAVRPISRLRVVSRTPEHAQALTSRACALGLDAGVAGPEAVADADIVCACTTSATPLFDGALLPAGAHVNAIGSYRPDTREVDDATVSRARIVVETRAAALAEAGDLLIPIERGVIAESSIVGDLREAVLGAQIRTGPNDITLFKSVGVAFEDLAVASAVLPRDQSGHDQGDDAQHHRGGRDQAPPRLPFRQ